MNGVTIVFLAFFLACFLAWLLFPVFFLDGKVLLLGNLSRIILFIYLLLILWQLSNPKCGSKLVNRLLLTTLHMCFLRILFFLILLIPQNSLEVSVPTSTLSENRGRPQRKIRHLNCESRYTLLEFHHIAHAWIKALPSAVLFLVFAIIPNIITADCTN